MQCFSYKNIRRVYKHRGVLTEACSQRRNYSGNYCRWFRSVCCTPLICLLIFQCLVKQPSLRGMEHLHFTAVLSLMGQRKQRPTFIILSSLIPMAPELKIRTATPQTQRHTQMRGHKGLLPINISEIFLIIHLSKQRFSRRLRSLRCLLQHTWIFRSGKQPIVIFL